MKRNCLVKDLSRLLTSQVPKNNGKHYFCLRCLNPFLCQQSLNKHREYCQQHDSVKIEMPEPVTILKFENYYRSEKVPFVDYANFESYIKLLDTCSPNLEHSYTKQYEKHEPSRFCCNIKPFDERVYKSKKVSYTGEDAAQKFVEMSVEDIDEIANLHKKEIIFGEEERKRYDMTSKCWICGKECTKDDGEKNYKVRDHCHFTGRFRGAAHNLKYRRFKFTPVLFHDLSGYDAHFFIKKSWWD